MNLSLLVGCLDQGQLWFVQKYKMGAYIYIFDWIRRGFIYVHVAVKNNPKARPSKDALRQKRGGHLCPGRGCRSPLLLSALWEEYGGMSMAVFSGRTCFVLRKFYSWSMRSYAFRASEKWTPGVAREMFSFGENPTIKMRSFLHRRPRSSLILFLESFPSPPSVFLLECQRY